MKIATRISLVIALAMSVMSPMSKVMADNVDSQKARKVGAYFMAAQFGSKAITAENIKLVYEIPNVAKSIPTLYAFNTADERGFVIVAGTDCVDPIIAYSTDGCLDPNNIPPAMQWWLKQQANVIAYCQNEELEPADNHVMSWKTLEEQRLPYFGQDSKAVTRLLETQWNQNYPYNALCPVVTNGTYDVRGRAYAGCVATAMSQIIRYWKYPRQGNGSHGYHINNSQAGLDTTLTVNFGESYYDYDKMPAKLTSSSAEEEIHEVAKLHYHCGVSVEMGYDGDGSGAVSDRVLDALGDYFKYVEDSIQMYSREAYRFNNPNRTTSPNRKDTLWVDLIVNEIMKGRPVYYAGSSPEGGRDSRHAFVCDGYRDDSHYLHFNWGWGGSGDSWCNVYTAQLKPSRSPEAGVTYNFYEDNRIIIGITPPQDSIASDPVSVVEAENPFLGAIFPNPASTQVTVSYMLRDDRPSVMQVFDVAGHIVNELEVSPASTCLTFSVANLHPGIYFCRINGYTQKFVVK